MLQLQSGFMSLRHENVERSEIAGIMQAMERGFQIVNGNMRRMALQPSRRRAVLTTATTTNANDGAENGEGTDDVAGERALLAPALAMTNPATLMPNPKVFTTCGLNIYTSRGESLQGCSRNWRGRVKYKYTRRKVIWDVVRDLELGPHFP
ncbi:hypothetical protein MHU86_6320 [Fragilaria crotonensis]|nr:hypothetical protein MHU86_6320 [Fragilaria crotonensis]